MLAAGLGSRLGTLTRELPKCMVEVGGRSILSRMIASLEAVGVRRLVIVTGYLHEVLEEYALGLQSNLAIEFVHNVDYASTNNIYSLWLANEAIRSDFYLLESDLLFDERLLTDLRWPSSAAVSPLSDVMDGTVLTANGEGVVQEFYLKQDPRPPEPLLKTINIYRFSLEVWSSILAPLFKDMVSRGETNVYYELVFAEAVRSGRLKLFADVFSDKLWCEVDTPEDYERAITFD